MKYCFQISFFLSLVLFINRTSGQGIIIPSGTYLVMKSGTHLTTHKKFVNNGSFTANDGSTVIFAGATSSIEGSTASTFNNITVKSGSTTTVNTSGTLVKAIVKSDGTFNANSNLTLLSTATQTALVDGSGTGDVTGSLTMQRYMASGNGYKYISSPFQSATVNDLADDLDLVAAFPRLYNYDENEDATGWHTYTTGTDPLSVMNGYAGNFGLPNTAITIDMSGVVSNGSLTPLTIYNHNKTYTQGFNLMGNPYPSPIDWEAPSGWTRTNLDDAVYFFNTSGFQYTGHYSSYINGVSSDNVATGIIPAMQGFFVHVSDGSYPVSASFGINNNARINDLNPVYHKGTAPDKPLIRMVAQYTEDTAMKDAIVVYFEEKANKGFDKSFDALKLMNTDERVPNLFVISPESQKISISAMPEPQDSIEVVPLGLKISNAGMLSLNATTLVHMPGSLNIYLADAKTGTLNDLSVTPEYKLYLDKGEYNDRFSIVFGKKALTQQMFNTDGLNVYSNGEHLMVYLNLVTGMEGDLVVNNVLGQSISRVSIFRIWLSRYAIAGKQWYLCSEFVF